MSYLEIIEKKINPLFARPYKGGLELRGVNMDSAKSEIETIIKNNDWPVEIFETDVRVKSISIRIINK